MAPFTAPRYGDWHQSLIGGGGYLQGVVIAPSNPNRQYAWVDVANVFRSDDAGRTWRSLLGSFPPASTSQPCRAFSVDPRDENTILVGTSDHWTTQDGLWRSTDGGKTFRKVLTATYLGNADYRWAGLLIARDPRNPDRLVTATQGSGAFESLDNGKTWKPLGLQGVNATDVKIDVSAPQRMWVCAQPYDSWLFGKERAGLTGGLYRTEDAGKHWVKLADEAPSELIQDPKLPGRLIAIFNGGSDVRSSEDLGGTWKPLSDGLTTGGGGSGPRESEYQSLAAGPDFVLTCSTQGTFYRLPSGGSTWEKVANESVEENYAGARWNGAWDGKGWRHFGKAAASITIDPRDPRHWMFTDWYALWRTRDAGKTWKLDMDGIEVTVLHAFQQDPTNPRLSHLGMADNGYLRSVDGGARYRTAHLNSNMKSLTLSPKAPQIVYGVGDPQNGQWYSNTVYRSDDSGANWRRLQPKGLPNMEERRANSIVADPRDDRTVYLAVEGEVGLGKGGVYVSRDRGENWTWEGQGLPQGKPFFHREIWVIGREIACDSAGNLVVFSDSGRAVYRRPAGSTTFEPVAGLAVAPNELAADPARPGHFLLAVPNGGVYRSTDAGRTWRVTKAGSGWHVAYDLAKPGRAVASTNTTVELSLDGGATWRTLDTRLPNRVRAKVGFAGNRVLAGTGGSGAFWINVGKQR